MPKQKEPRGRKSKAKEYPLSNFFAASMTSFVIFIYPSSPIAIIDAQQHAMRAPGRDPEKLGET